MSDNFSSGESLGISRELCSEIGIDPAYIRPISKRGASSIYEVRDEEHTRRILKVASPFSYKSNAVADFMNRYFQKEILPRNYREDPGKNTPEMRVLLESRVLKNWGEANIPAPRVHWEDGESRMLMDYVDGTDYKTLLKSGRFRDVHLRGLMDTVEKVRRLALSKGDIDYLHNDLHLGNIMFCRETGAAKAIDPGLPLNRDYDFDTLDASVNLFFLHSLGNGCFFDPQDFEKERGIISDSFLELIDRESLERMSELNEPLNSIYLAYIVISSKIRGDRKHLGWISTFGKEGYGAVQKKIDSRLKR